MALAGARRLAVVSPLWSANESCQHDGGGRAGASQHDAGGGSFDALVSRVRVLPRSPCPRLRVRCSLVSLDPSIPSFRVSSPALLSPPPTPFSLRSDTGGQQARRPAAGKSTPAQRVARPRLFGPPEIHSHARGSRSPPHSGTTGVTRSRSLLTHQFEAYEPAPSHHTRRRIACLPPHAPYGPLQANGTADRLPQFFPPKSCRSVSVNGGHPPYPRIGSWPLDA